MAGSVKNYTEILAKLKTCDIDKEGHTFKYILIRIAPKNVKKESDNYITKTLVRGYEKCFYHGTIEKVLTITCPAKERMIYLNLK